MSMKKDTACFLFFLAGLLAAGNAAMAQSAADDSDVVRVQRLARPYKPGQLLVKFKDNSQVTVHRARGMRIPDNSTQSVEKLVAQFGISSIEQLMPASGRPVANGARRLRSVTGKLIDDSDLTRLYLVKCDPQQVTDVMAAVEAFSQLDEVEFAEPNYIVQALGRAVHGAPLAGTPAVRAETQVPIVTTDDPLYSQQWGPAAIGLPQLWATSTQNVLGRRPVVAILDTGVDIDHPDLKDNIWTNDAELNGVEGEDDDLNGYTDDLHGWDCVNQTGRLGDWNGHGTHCAGIAAAVAGNGIGIVGANPDALIMPVTVLQSDGMGDVGTIIRGLEYAMSHQADVISMSLGGYGYSTAEELALGKAYHYSVIVAAAGNDGACIYPGHTMASRPMYPGAFTFVLGVQASRNYADMPKNCPVGKAEYAPWNQNPWRAYWSNFDDDGPVFTSFDEEKLYNYELLAPGQDIISTYPGGRYLSMNGTSMATPLAAGAVSRLLQTKEYSSKEQLFGDLIASSNADTKVLDMKAAYDITDADRQPTLMLVSYVMNDSINGDGDGRFDAGETIDFYPIVRNTWGEAVGIRCSLSTSDNEDAEMIEVLENDVDFGRTLSSYGKERSLNPIRFRISDNCVDGRHIRLTVSTTCENGTSQTINQDFVITVENGEELGGILAKNTTLDATKHYIINKSLAIPNGITLIIPAGTTVKFHDGALLKVADGGRIRAVGTAEKPIIFTKGDLSQGYIPTLQFNDNCQFRYCHFTMLSAGSDTNQGGVNLISGGRFTDCVFRNCYVGDHGMTGMNTTRCNIIENEGYAGIEQGNTHRNTNIMDNTVLTPDGLCYHKTPWFNFLPAWTDFQACNLTGSYINFMGHYANVASITLEPTVIYSDYPSYLGSGVEKIARRGVLDYNHELNNDHSYTSFGVIDLSNMLTQPSSEAHGVVWKILVDGLDAQDEYEQIPPLGVGRHKVEVYFNRPMDTTVQPWLSMGVRPPYTQTFINEDASWSDDGKVYTAYLTLTAKSAFDGINRFYVADAQDLEHFVIPTERARFNVPVSAAGSKSTGFMAQTGLGKVVLTWEAAAPDEIEDVMGYNLYRYTLGDDGTPSDTLRVNNAIIEQSNDGSELSYTDYDVTPGTTYYYYYRTLRTTLDSTDPSLVVAATPLTAQKGDANGSMDVTVTDVMAIIAYLTGENPQPFIAEAADINGDGTINILDVVGTINIALAADLSQQGAQALPVAGYTVEDGILYIDSPVSIAGMQLLLTNDNGEVVCQPLEPLHGMEYAATDGSEGEYQFLAFSMAGRTIAAGHRGVLRVGDACVAALVLSDTEGREVSVAYQQPTVIEMPNSDQLPIMNNSLYDLQGRKIVNSTSANSRFPRGVYIVNGKKICF